MNSRQISRHISHERFSRLLRSCSAARTVGLLPTGQWLLGTAQGYFGITSPRSYSIRPSFLSYPVKLRTGTSDYFIFRQIMIENEHKPLKDLPVTTVLDLGANIGLASAWLLNRFPEARVFAVEADAENYAICCENLAPYGNRACVLHGAAWSSRSILTLCRRSCAADNRMQESTDRNPDTELVQGWDIPSLIEMSGFAQIDLLKIDIEGAEANIFSTDVSRWLGRVRNLCIELHGQECQQIFFSALSRYDYQHAQSGELDLCINLKLKAAA